MTTTRRCISEPAEWWNAFIVQAKEDGAPSLSEWMGDCCKANLSEDVQKGLCERVTNRAEATNTEG